MKLFGFKRRNESFRISNEDRLWVEGNFKWLVKVLGYSNREVVPFLYSEICFPETFKHGDVLIENIIQDLCSLIQIQKNKITFEMICDLRDAYGTPYEIEGEIFETELEVREGKYKIYIANSLKQNPNRLIYNLVYEFIRIKLTDNKLKFEMGSDTNLFIYLAGVYFGFGVILSQGLEDTGRIVDGFWETKWNYISKMPNEIMAFCLATYSILNEQYSPKWKENLPSELKSRFEKAIKFIAENPSELLSNKELEASRLFKSATDQYFKNDFKGANVNLHKILTLTNDDVLKADVYNNLGYNYIRLKNFEQSVAYLKNSIQIIPDYGFANDNLGYALIQMGKLEEGKNYLERALKTESNDVAYTFRNFALYYQAIGDFDNAQNFFKKSFESILDSVDLLEYHYSEFLMQKGETNKGIDYLKKAVAKKEPEAIKKMNELKIN